MVVVMIGRVFRYLHHRHYIPLSSSSLLLLLLLPPTRWQATADRGWVITGFGEEAALLLSSSVTTFDKETQAYALSPLRVQRHDELDNTIRLVVVVVVMVVGLAG